MKAYYICATVIVTDIRPLYVCFSVSADNIPDAYGVGAAQLTTAFVGHAQFSIDSIKEDE